MALETKRIYANVGKSYRVWRKLTTDKYAKISDTQQRQEAIKRDLNTMTRLSGPTPDLNFQEYASLLNNLSQDESYSVGASYKEGDSVNGAFANHTLYVYQVHLYFDFYLGPYTQYNLDRGYISASGLGSIVVHSLPSKTLPATFAARGTINAFSSQRGVSSGFTVGDYNTYPTMNTFSSAENYGTLLYIVNWSAYNNNSEDIYSTERGTINPDSCYIEIEYTTPPVYGTYFSSYCGTGENRFTKYKKVADGKGGTVDLVEANNSEDCGYIPEGRILSTKCGVGDDRFTFYNVVSDGNGGTKDVVAEHNSSRCGYIPPGTPLEYHYVTQDGMLENFQAFDYVESRSTGNYFLESNSFGSVIWQKEKILVEHNSAFAGYPTNSNVNFSSNAEFPYILVTGKSPVTVGNQYGYIGGQYSYLALKEGYEPSYGNFTVNSGSTNVNIQMTKKAATAFVKVQSFPFSAYVTDSNGNYKGPTNVGEWIEIPADTDTTLTVSKIGYDSQVILVRGQAGEQIHKRVDLVSNQKSPSSEVYELKLIDPKTYGIFSLKTLSNTFDISVAKSMNSIGSLNFTVPMSIRDFEDSIATGNGQAGILVYLNGEPFFQAVISNYSPVDTQFTRVECSEVLSILSEDIREGYSQVSNIYSEPSSNQREFSAGSSVEEASLYWGKFTNPDNYFYALRNGNNLSYSGGKITSGELNKGFVINKKLNRNRVRKYTCVFGRTSKLPSYWYYTFEEPNSRYEDLLAITRGIRGRVDIYDGKIYIEAVARSYYSSETLAVSAGQIKPITVEGRQYSVEEIIQNGNTEIKFSYEELYGNIDKIKLTAKLVVNFFGSTYSADTEVVVDYGSYCHATYENQAGIFLKEKEGIGYYYLENTKRLSLYDWIKEAAPQINWFLDGGKEHPMYKNALRIAFSNGDSWQFVSKILELAGNVSLVYVGIIGGKPSYIISDTDKLPVKRLFVEGNKIYDISYQKDFSDTYNTLIVTASSNTEGETLSVSNNIRVAIIPDKEKLALWLGRTKRKVVATSGFKDVASLTEYALALYEENSYPSEPIDFKTLINDEWVRTPIGQYVELFGLPDGRKVTEQIVTLTFADSTNEISVELGKRKSLASIIMSATIAANTY